MNKGLTKRILSLVCAAAVMLSLNITAVFATTDSVEVYAAESYGAFSIPPQKISVSADSAENFGYTDKNGIITALDAMTAMYAAAYGEKFKNSSREYLEVSESGYITKAGGVKTSAVGFMINGRTPNNGVYNETYQSYNAYTIADAPIADGDVFESFLYVDTSDWTDTYSFFDKRTVTASLGEKVSLTLSSFMTLYGAYKEDEIADNTSPEVGIEVKKYVDGTNDIVLCTTDDDGKAEFTADAAGTSIIYAETDEGIPAWCELTVESPSADAIAKNIAATFTAPYSSWEILDLAAYGNAPTLSTEDIGALTDAAVASNNLFDIERVVLELTAAGINATEAVNSNGETVNLIKLISDTSENNLGYVTASIFALLAYDSGNYTITDGLTREKLIDIILSERNEDGVYGYSWGGSSYVDYDSTAMALAAIAPYTDEARVKEAADLMLSALSAAQGENGSWGSANTDAMVICGLAAMGIDIDGSTDFIKNGKTAVDGLLTYTVPTNDGFCYTDPNTANTLATEQGFRALAAYLGAKSTGKAFSVYRFRDFSEKEITVTFEMYGDKIHGSKSHSGSYPIWIEKTSTKVLEDSTVLSLFCNVLDENGFTYEGAEKGYISYITHLDGTRLGELDNGAYSGWLYTVNGDEPDVSMDAYTLKDKDNVRVYYTDDWRKTYNPNKKPSSGSGSGGSSGSGFSPSTSTAVSVNDDPQTDTTDDNAAEAENKNTISFDDVTDEHWAHAYITALASRGIINGDENGSFNPEANISRAEFCAILSRCSDADISETEGPFSDVASDSWYSGYVIWAYNQGIVNGVGENTFAPDAPVSRQDMSVMIMRYADKFNVGIPSADETTLRDMATVSDYAADAVARLSGCGIINGDKNGNFNPENSAARAEAAKIIYLLLYK